MHERIGIAAALAASVLIGATAAAQDAPRAEAGPGGFAISSADRHFRLRLRGLIQLDGRVYGNDSDNDTQWLMRRVRPSFEGTFGERIGFRIMPDFAGGQLTLMDAYVDTQITDGITLRAGKLKVPVGLERLQSGNDLRLVERSVVTDLLPNRDIGLQLGGGGTVSWSVGLFNGVNDGRSGDGDEDGNQGLAFRLFVQPLAGDSAATLGFGIAGTYGSRDGVPGGASLLASYRSPGQKNVFQYRGGADGTFADGSRTTLTPQLYWYTGPFGLLTEWARVSHDVRRIGADFDRSATLDQEAWQVTAEWLVTGGNAGFSDPSTPGAVQLAFRYAELDIDDASFAGGAESFANPAAAVSQSQTAAIGVNWFPIVSLKTSFAYHQTSFTGGAATGDRPDERVFFIRVQHRF